MTGTPAWLGIACEPASRSKRCGIRNDLAQKAAVSTVLVAALRFALHDGTFPVKTH